MEYNKIKKVLERVLVMKIKTKAYQSEIRKEEVGFSNYERVDELSLFNEVFSRLNRMTNVIVGRKRIGPSEDYYDCKIDGKDFTLFYDIDYGVCVYATEETTREHFIQCFNHKAD